MKKFICFVALCSSLSSLTVRADDEHTLNGPWWRPYAEDCTEAGLIAYTFDDGPEYATPDILNILEQKSVKGTFFVLGKHLANYPDQSKDILQQINDGGHLLANHGWTHKRFTTLSSEQILTELYETHKLVYEYSGVKMTMMRPPYGNINIPSARTVWETGYSIVGWNYMTFDHRPIGAYPAEDMLSDFKRFIDGINADYDSAIIVMHDKSPQVLEVLADMIDYSDEAGFQSVTMSECLTRKDGFFNSIYQDTDD